MMHTHTRADSLHPRPPIHQTLNGLRATRWFRAVHTRARVRTHTDGHTHTHTHTHIHAQMQTRRPAHSHTHTHTHSNTPRLGARGREFVQIAGNTMVQSGAAFGFFLAVGSALRC